VCPREELTAERLCQPGHFFVDFDHGLNSARRPAARSPETIRLQPRLTHSMWYVSIMCLLCVIALKLSISAQTQLRT